MPEVNDVGEPCAGEPHARFDRGPLAKQTPTVRRKRDTQRETGGTEPVHLRGDPDQPAAYLTPRRGWAVNPDGRGDGDVS